MKNTLKTILKKLGFNGSTTQIHTCLPLRDCFWTNPEYQYSFSKPVYLDPYGLAKYQWRVQEIKEDEGTMILSWIREC